MDQRKVAVFGDFPVSMLNCWSRSLQQSTKNVIICLHVRLQSVAFQFDAIGCNWSTLCICQHLQHRQQQDPPPGLPEMVLRRASCRLRDNRSHYRTKFFKHLKNLKPFWVFEDVLKRVKHLNGLELNPNVLSLVYLAFAGWPFQWVIRPSLHDFIYIYIIWVMQILCDQFQRGAEMFFNFGLETQTAKII